jgi:hypothetical protein
MPTGLIFALQDGNVNDERCPSPIWVNSQFYVAYLVVLHHKQRNCYELVNCLRNVRDG